MKTGENESNCLTEIINYPAGNSFFPLPQQVTASMNTGSSGVQGNAGAGGESWTELVDEVIYPRLKFKERYMETPEAPFQ